VPPVRTGSLGLQYVSQEQALLRVSKFDKHTIVLLGEGVHLVTSTARTLDDLQHQVCADRLALATELLAAGNKLLRSRPPQYRSAISRYYYCMYHSARAVVYFSHGGDDFEKHSDLPGRVPADFKDSDLWRNALKDARSHRNDADYDPYPANPQSWRAIAVHLSSNAADLLSEAQEYLKRKGCGHV
jgi:uncharacterized protein (UPF0332 family)